MITEDYCSFEIAKLLKDKGFNEQCRAAYTNYGKLFTTQIQQYVTNVLCSKGTLWDCTAPTLQMAKKWLREKYYIYADPIKQGNYNDCSEYYTWIVARMGIIHRNSTVADKLSYEEACEAAIKYCLEHLV